MVNQFDLLGLGLSSSPKLWQPVTYMFIHGDFFHIFMNMFVLWMFGTEMESIWGSRKFLRHYFVTGIGSGIIWLIFNYGNSYSVLIGASGAIYGILLAYGLMFPNRKVLIYFLFPIKVKYFVTILAAIAFVSSIDKSGSNISHLTHLSGMIVGFLYLKFPNIKYKTSILVNRKIAESINRKSERKKANMLGLQKKVDRLLDKVSNDGFNSLSDDEKDQLYTYSKRLGRDIKKD
jgi:membrane associated rhomboid family serine protease